MGALVWSLDVSRAERLHPGSEPEPPLDRILDAAESRFRRFGLGRTRIDEITDEADVGKGTLYLYFPSKAELYLAVVERCVSRFTDLVSVVIGEGSSALQRLGALVAAAAEFYRQDELLASSLMGDDDLVKGRVASIAAEVQRVEISALIAEALRQGQAEGVIRAELDPESTGRLLFELGWAVVRRQLEGRSTATLAEDLAALNDLVGVGTMVRTQTR